MHRKPRNPAPARNSAYDWAEIALGHRFGDPALVVRALTHKSAGTDNYERLEFLGDRVLGLTIAAWLFAHFPNDAEGRLNTRFARIVSRATCADIGRSIRLGPQIALGAQARGDGAADSDNILGDVVEALIGALWLDAGMEKTQETILRLFRPALDAHAVPVKHPKSAVQEWAAAKGVGEPAYSLAGQSGPPHQPTFVVALDVPGFARVTAEGTSKQEAETLAAERFLDSRKAESAGTDRRKTGKA